MKSRQEMIDNVMDWFDFERVRKVVKGLQWTWFGCEAEGGIPDIPHLREAARKKLNYVFDEYEKTGEGWAVASGGFEARLTVAEDGSVGLFLKFVVSNWDCWNTEED